LAWILHRGHRWPLPESVEVGLRILLIDEDAARAEALDEALRAAGYEMVARIDPQDDVLAKMREIEPDLVIVDMESPSRDTFEDMRRITEERPRPIVMFVDQSDDQAIADAMRVGVSAYVIDGLNPRRVKPILDVAVARFTEYQKLRAELEQTRMDLADRKVIERAKGILMETRGLSEDDSYKLLRKLAMDQNQKVVDVARVILGMSPLLKP
jgi:two-component system, response regulator / RNA-binding antiterminator